MVSLVTTFRTGKQGMLLIALKTTVCISRVMFKHLKCSDSPLTDYHAALGQFLNYRLALEITEPARVLYLAIPVVAYESFFRREFT